MSDLTARTFDAPNGDKFRIAPFTPGTLSKALTQLKAKGIDIKPGDTDLLGGVEFQAAIAGLVLLDWQKNVGGTMHDTTQMERVQLIRDRQRVVTWIVKKAQDIAEEADKEFEVDAGN